MIVVFCYCPNVIILTGALYCYCFVECQQFPSEFRDAVSYRSFLSQLLTITGNHCKGRERSGVRASPFVLQSTMATNGNVSSPEYYPYADSVASSTNPLAGRSSPQPGSSQAPPDYPGVGVDVVGSTEAGARRDGEEERQGEVSWVHVFRARGNLARMWRWCECCYEPRHGRC